MVALPEEATDPRIPGITKAVDAAISGAAISQRIGIGARLIGLTLAELPPAKRVEIMPLIVEQIKDWAVERENGLV
jgi:hypothetical protein